MRKMGSHIFFLRNLKTRVHQNILCVAIILDQLGSGCKAKERESGLFRLTGHEL